MKFLCVPCDSPMKLQTVVPPDRGSLSVVYSCPECGYEIAMLTNAYETQVVQSLGVKIGPGASASQAEAGAAGTSGAGCPFTAMIPGNGEVQPGAPDARTLRDGVEPGVAVETIPVRWTAAAEARLKNIPEFVRPMAKIGIEKFARDRGTLEVDETILDAAKDFFGM